MLAPPRKLGKCGAVWCVLVYIWIRVCLEKINPFTTCTLGNGIFATYIVHRKTPLMCIKIVKLPYQNYLLVCEISIIDI